MAEIDPVILQLRAEMQQYKNELRSTTVLVSNQLDRQERAITSLETHVERSTYRVGQSFAAMRDRITGYLGGIALGAVIVQLSQLADASKKMDAELRLATASFGSFGQAQADVQRIADDTRGSLEATTKLYGGFVRASQETGRTQADAARATETFAKALKISGAGAADAASATLQFNQALQSGVLRGDEFNSIMEASPRIARLLAEALGVPIGQLRKMAEEGKITSDILFRALTERKYTAGIDAEFKQIPVTFGDAMQAMENAALTSFSQFDKGGRFSEALVAFLGTGTDTFEGLTSRAEEFGRDTRSVMDGLANVFDPILIGGNSVFDALGVRIYSVRDQIASLLQSFDDVANFDTNIENAVKRGLNRAIDRAGGGQKFQEAPLQNLGGRFRSGARLSDARGRVDAAARRLEAQGYTVPRNPDGSVNESGIIRRQQGARPAYRPQSEETAASKALAKHRETLAGLEKLKVDASRAELATINTKIAREKKIIANLEKGVSPSAATAAVASGRGGKSTEQKEAEQAAKDYAQLMKDVQADLREGLSRTGDLFQAESERLERSRRNTQSIFGVAGKDYQDPFAGVDEYDQQQDRKWNAMEQVAQEAEQNAQRTRVDNIRSLANLYGDLFTRNSADVWRNFKEDGLRTIALLLAQATVASFSKGGGGFGSLLGNIGKAFSSGTGGLATLFGRASGGYVAPGQTVRVNEQAGGMELLRMGSQGGTVIPLGQTRAERPSGGTTVMQTIQVDARGAVMNDQFASQILARAGQDARQVVQANNSLARKSLPAAQARFGNLGTTG